MSAEMTEAIPTTMSTPQVDRSLHVKLAIESVMLVIGLIGNGLLVLIFIRHKKLRTSSNTYLIIIASCDLLVTFICPGMLVITDLRGTWPLGSIGCKLSHFTMCFSGAATIMALLAVSIERYYAIVYPIKRFTSTRTYSIVLNIIIPIMSLLVAIPQFLSYDVKEYAINNKNETILRCELREDKYEFIRYQSLFSLIVFYIVPGFVITTAYSCVSCHLTKDAKASITKPSELNRKRKSISKVVLILTAIFFLGFLPYYLISLKIFLYGGTKDFWKSNDVYGHCFGCLHFVLNPIGLYLSSDAFKKEYNYYLFGWMIKVKQNCTKQVIQESLTVKEPSSGTPTTTTNSASSSGIV